MLENWSFDHYFGTSFGVRGFRDRHPAPMPAGDVFQQAFGEPVISLFHLDSATTSSAFYWQTIPEVLEVTGTNWRIYQNPNPTAARTCTGGEIIWRVPARLSFPC